MITSVRVGMIQIDYESGVTGRAMREAEIDMLIEKAIAAFNQVVPEFEMGGLEPDELS